jgi:hypothetical protein
MSNTENTPPSATQNRRGSFTTQTFNSIFGRSNSTGHPTAPFPGPISTAAAQDQQRRRVSISTLGLSGTSPTQISPFFGGRRSSISTEQSDSIDESAIDDDDSPARRASFTRRMSVGAQALRARSNGGSPGASGRTPSYTKSNSPLPPIPAGSTSGGESTLPQAYQASMQSKPRTASDFPVSPRPGESGGFNWSEQLRSRAESSVSQSQRPSFSTSPTFPKMGPLHDRARSADMSSPPASAPAPAPPPAKPARKQPDAFQERILKGDFYMD